MIKVIKVREVRIAIEVKRSDAGDVSPVAMFSSKVIQEKVFFARKRLRDFLHLPSTSCFIRACIILVHCSLLSGY